jgi:hypothetical protein
MAGVNPTGKEQKRLLLLASDQAALCNARFATVRDSVLGESSWRFATQRHELAADAAAPAFGYTYRYPFDNTVIQVLEVYPDSSTYGYREPLEEWEREGQWILTNHASPIFMKSVDQVEDVSLGPPGFCRAPCAARIGTSPGTTTSARSI